MRQTFLALFFVFAAIPLFAAESSMDANRPVTTVDSDTPPTKSKKIYNSVYLTDGRRFDGDAISSLSLYRGDSTTLLFKQSDVHYVTKEPGGYAKIFTNVGLMIPVADHDFGAAGFSVTVLDFYFRILYYGGLSLKYSLLLQEGLWIIPLTVGPTFSLPYEEWGAEFDFRLLFGAAMGLYNNNLGEDADINFSFSAEAWVRKMFFARRYSFDIGLEYFRTKFDFDNSYRSTFRSFIYHVGVSIRGWGAPKLVLF